MNVGMNCLRDGDGGRPGRISLRYSLTYSVLLYRSLTQRLAEAFSVTESWSPARSVEEILGANTTLWSLQLPNRNGSAVTRSRDIGGRCPPRVTLSTPHGGLYNVTRTHSYHSKTLKRPQGGWRVGFVILVLGCSGLFVVSIVRKLKSRE